MTSKQPPLRGVVTVDWNASYEDPIELSAGAPVRLTGRRDIWDGYLWLWAQAEDGKEGWVPNCLLSSTDPDSAVEAVEAYCAQELTCKAGQVLTVERILHGWALCRDEREGRGWVPTRHLAIEDA